VPHEKERASTLSGCAFARGIPWDLGDTLARPVRLERPIGATDSFVDRSDGLPLKPARIRRREAHTRESHWRGEALGSTGAFHLQRML
jgi:hypothetical protein